MSKLMNSLTKTLNQRGQGAVEYVLLLGLTVAIVLGILLQLNKGVQAWANNYFGDYLTCLLETGELPSLGGGGGECAQEFKPFQIAKTDTSNGGKNGGGSSDGSTGGSGSGNDDDDKGRGEERTPPQSAAADGASDDVSSAGRSRGSKRFSARTRNVGTADKKGSDSEGSATPVSEFDMPDGSRRILVVESEERRRRRREQAEAATGRSKVAADKTLEEGRQGAPVLQKRLKRTVASADEESGFEFSFGNILRWLLIIALIIAIVIFIGGQILQVSKSVD